MTYAILVGGPLDGQAVPLGQEIEGPIVMLDAGRALFYTPTNAVGLTSGPDPQPYRRYSYSHATDQSKLEAIGAL